MGRITPTLLRRCPQSTTTRWPSRIPHMKDSRKQVPWSWHRRVGAVHCFSSVHFHDEAKLGVPLSVVPDASSFDRCRTTGLAPEAPVILVRGMIVGRPGRPVLEGDGVAGDPLPAAGGLARSRRLEET